MVESGRLLICCTDRKAVPRVRIPPSPFLDFRRFPAPGVKIGANAVIGSRSTVLNDIPAPQLPGAILAARSI